MTITLPEPTISAQPDDDWHDRRTCANGAYGPKMWFSTVMPGRAVAQHVCLTHCPVLESCRAFAEPAFGGVSGGVAHARSGAIRSRGQQPADKCGMCPQPPARLPATAREQCGKRYGYALHNSAGEQPCDPCIQANRTYNNEWAKTNRRYGGRS